LLWLWEMREIYQIQATNEIVVSAEFADVPKWLFYIYKYFYKWKKCHAK
jgi:hypothetical protein